jgi:hypothetical protein
VGHFKIFSPFFSQSRRVQPDSQSNRQAGDVFWHFDGCIFDDRPFLMGGGTICSCLLVLLALRLLSFVEAEIRRTPKESAFL